jgi:hypothetical protein
MVRGFCLSRARDLSAHDQESPMNPPRFIPGVLFAVLNLALSSQALDQEAARSPDTALRVAALLDSRSVIEPAIVGTLPDGTARDLAEQAAQVDRLSFLLSHGAKENLVARP